MALALAKSLAHTGILTITLTKFFTPTQTRRFCYNTLLARVYYPMQTSLHYTCLKKERWKNGADNQNRQWNCIVYVIYFRYRLRAGFKQAVA
jgi:hypothetical protein